MVIMKTAYVADNLWMIDQFQECVLLSQTDHESLQATVFLRSLIYAVKCFAKRVGRGIVFFPSQGCPYSLEDPSHTIVGRCAASIRVGVKESSSDVTRPPAACPVASKVGISPDETPSPTTHFLRLRCLRLKSWTTTSSVTPGSGWYFLSFSTSHFGALGFLWCPVSFWCRESPDVWAYDLWQCLHAKGWGKGLPRQRCLYRLHCHLNTFKHSLHFQRRCKWTLRWCAFTISFEENDLGHNLHWYFRLWWTLSAWRVASDRWPNVFLQPATGQLCRTIMGTCSADVADTHASHFPGFKTARQIMESSRTIQVQRKHVIRNHSLLLHKVQLVHLPSLFAECHLLTVFGFVFPYRWVLLEEWWFFACNPWTEQGIGNKSTEMLYGHMYSVLLCCSSQWCEFFRNASRSGRIIHGDTIAVLTPEFVFFIPYCVHVSREVSGHSSQ